MEQILLQAFKTKFIKLSSKYFFLKDEQEKSIKRKDTLNQWIQDFFNSNNKQVSKSEFTKEFLEKFRNSSRINPSYDEICEEVEDDLLTENNAFRERLQYCQGKAKADFKKVKRKLKKYQEKVKEFCMATQAKISANFGKKELIEFINKLEKGKIREGLKGIEILVGLCWQVRLLLQELFEFNSGLDTEKKEILSRKLNVKQFGKCRVLVWFNF
jgi:hypothetical protein